MKLFIYEMEDCGEYSFERYYVLANGRRRADKLVAEESMDEEILKRPHSVREIDTERVFCEIH